MEVNWRSAWQGSPGGAVPAAWNIRSYPSIFVLDETGRIRYRDVRGEALDDAVATLLAELKAKQSESQPAAVQETPLRTVLPREASFASAKDEAAFDSLVESYTAAYDAWRKSLRAAPEEERAALYEEDPTGDYVSRFRVLADRGVGRAGMWLLENHEEADWGLRLSLFEELVERHADAEWIGGLAGAAWELVTGEDLDRVLRGYDALLARTTRTEDAEKVAFSVARVLARSDHRDLALERFRQQIERWPAGRYTDRAQGKVFALENLVVGREAPEITGNDVDGNALALSAQRGKVVVLDFWGFW